MYTNNNETNTKPAVKCKFNPSTRKSKMDGKHFMYLTCEENCTDKNGEPAIIDF